MVQNDEGPQRFCKVYIKTVNNFAPIKQKNAQGHQMPFMTKEFSKEGSETVFKKMKLRKIK